MAIMVSDSGGGGDFKLVPAGNHVAICNLVADLGRQKTVSQQYGEKIKHQVYLRWELPDETVEWTDKEGKQHTGPMSVSKTYTASLHENAQLRKDLENWRGRPFTQEELQGFDLSSVADVPALVNVTHTARNGKTHVNVSGVTPLPKSMPKPAMSDAALIYDSDHMETFGLLPEWLQKKITEQVLPGEMAQMPPELAGDLDDAMPF